METLWCTHDIHILRRAITRTLLNNAQHFFGLDSLVVKIKSEMRPVYHVKNCKWANILYNSQLIKINDETVLKFALSFSIAGRLCRSNTVFLRALPMLGVSPAEFWRIVQVIRIQNKILFVFE